jgi:hypothetical protein
MLRLCFSEFESDITALAQKNGTANDALSASANRIWRQCNCFVIKVIACDIYISDIHV